MSEVPRFAPDLDEAGCSVERMGLVEVALLAIAMLALLLLAALFPARVQ